MGLKVALLVRFGKEKNQEGEYPGYEKGQSQEDVKMVFSHGFRSGCHQDIAQAKLLCQKQDG